MAWLLLFKGDLDIAIHWGFNFAQERQARPKIIHWIKPLIGELKLNVDGSSKDEFQNAAGGGVLRDHTGNLIFGFSENFGYQNSLQAELLALHRGLCLCMEYNVSRVWIEVDAQVISVRISHIHREGNQAADFLSKYGHTHQNLQVFTEAQGELRGFCNLAEFRFYDCTHKYAHKLKLSILSAFQNSPRLHVLLEDLGLILKALWYV
ncbi:Uncharacterized protein TCM_004861 [Theobroma cacao]|uniref:RNase H type-1 domain-containing protein n=1 Tax=Theobroma cacao TaxID=3641 RepID=A0A061DZA2_THECC|nr:Uncharacterized protein TCM_004861 [Theobroma cacao]